MAENILEKIIKKKSENILNLKKTISIDKLDELINENHEEFTEAYKSARKHILSNEVIKHLETIQNA